ncbi:MAG: ABC transporter permease [Candidatus Marinimicrobia bacterium]|jgi:putative ABC transport system permease protein|nr:ABC transporter permease [Candidatus Neomarinimicrobiota bacterium]MBT3630511.1 ABC transporter permease [Candidatus Neomarinimicrobiota bacterium]MBT3823413.1 ABC transporter permease [Candidatus Neomarinimicrobiota bacterium]MBT4131748.1 ABC transporter permease [Candidatus Neomarinimicrobiota bacterium]MBT4295416.1 ABC transporter permease [Candidatus Neomarinimicrobiota bacterium]
MFRFLMKGMLRDRHRSLLPSIVVAMGVMLTVFMFTYMKGIFDDFFNNAAMYDSGHVKITSRAYYEEKDVLPNDLALEDGPGMMAMLRSEYPQLNWSERVKFGGLLDAFDENRETRAQVGAGGIGIDFFGADTAERNRWNLGAGLQEGTLPQKPGDIIMGKTLASQMDLKAGDDVTLISSTVNGSMVLNNFHISGIIYFGTPPMDKSMFLADINDVKSMLDMGDWSSEILGYFNTSNYKDLVAIALATEFNAVRSDPNDRFSPQMTPMLDDAGLRDYFGYASKAGSIMSFIMIFAMGIVLWNTGLMGAIRRYGEMGLRLAVGESKGHVYRSLIIESLGVALMGTIIGTIFGLGFSYWLQEVGFDIGSMMGDSQMLIPTIIRARITPTAFYIGFFPGVFATLLGAALSGLRIFKRDTASLFKELES